MANDPSEDMLRVPVHSNTCFSREEGLLPHMKRPLELSGLTRKLGPFGFDRWLQTYRRWLVSPGIAASSPRIESTDYAEYTDSIRQHSQAKRFSGLRGLT